MSPEQRPADEDEVKRAEREDSPDTTERQRPATEEEIHETEKESKDESPVYDTGGIRSSRFGSADDQTTHEVLPNEPHHADRVASQRIASEDEVKTAEREAER